jgi:integrase
MNLDLAEKLFINKNLSESTQSLYTLGLKQYCDLTKMTLEELLDEAEDEEENIPRLRKRKIDSYLPRFKKSLEMRKLAPQTIKVYVSAVKTFYKYYKITIPEVSTDVSDICLEKNEGRLLTKEEIQKMVEIAPIRDKTMIYLMAMTGMAQAEVRNLTIKKILDAASDALDKKIETVENLFEYEKELNEVILSLLITRKKVKYRYQSFIPPEVTKNIIYYLKERSYGRNEKIRITDINKELFVTHNGEKLTKSGVSSNFNRIGKKLGFTASEKGAYGFWRSHGLRKYFISTIINNTGDHILADYLVGHKIDKTKRAYWKADPDKLKAKYMEVVGFLSIDESKFQVFRSEEFKKLTAELKESKKESQNMKNEFRKILLINLEIDQLKESISMIENGKVGSKSDIPELKKHLELLQQEVIEKINNITVPDKNDKDYLSKLVEHSEIMGETKDKHRDI